MNRRTHRATAASGMAGWLACLLTASGVEKPAHIGTVYPAGGRQGAVVTVKIGGENVYGARTALISGSGVKAEILDSRDPNEGQLDPKKKNKKKNETVLDEIITLKVTIAPDAVPGNRDICLATEDKMSNKLIFQIGELAEWEEKEPNDKLKTATHVDALPALVQGRIMPGDVDSYRFPARKGQHLVVDVAARALLPYIADGVPGWFQPIVTLSDPVGKQVAVADSFRFSQDPVLFYDVPQDGEYTVSVRDSIYRGREDFVYRMRIGELPFITGIFPLGARAGTDSVPVRLSGVNLPVETLMIPVSAVAPSCFPVSVTNNGMPSNRRLFAVGDLPELVETNPALKEALAKSVALPVIVNGCIKVPGERHYYRFQGRKGQSIRLEVMARRLGSPLDSCLVLRDESGSKIAENDDVKDRGEGFITHQSDSAIACDLPRDGAYTVELYDTQGAGGNDFAYRLRISPPRPDFELRVTPASLILQQGGSVPLAVTVLRRDGFDGEIQLGMEKPPKGVSLDGPWIPAGVDRIPVTLSASGADAGRHIPHLFGTAVVAGKSVTHMAVPAENLMQAFLYQHLFPFQEETLLVTRAAVPFRVTPTLPSGSVLSLTIGKETSIPVTATRRPGYNGPIRLQFVEAPKGITFRNAVVPANKAAATIVIRVEAKVETNRVGNLLIEGSMPVEREATQEEKRWMAVKAAREAEAKRVAAGETNAVAGTVVATNSPPSGAAGQDSRPKPVMVTRPVVVAFPAVPYRLVENTERKPPDAKPGKTSTQNPAVNKH